MRTAGGPAGGASAKAAAGVAAGTPPIAKASTLDAGSDRSGMLCRLLTPACRRRLHAAATKTITLLPSAVYDGLAC